MFGWLVTDSPLGWMTQLNKSLNSFSPESGYSEKIDLIHTEDKARMHKKDAQDLSAQYLLASFSQVQTKVDQNSTGTMKPKT